MLCQTKLESSNTIAIPRTRGSDFGCVLSSFSSVCLGSCLLKSVPNRKKLPTGYVSLFVLRCRLWIPRVRAGGSECEFGISGAGFWLSERKVSDSRSPRFFSFLWFFLFFSPKEKKRKNITRMGNYGFAGVIHTIPTIPQSSRFPVSSRLSPRFALVLAFR